MTYDVALDAAMRLAAQGYSVFPVHANKVPATPHGFRDAVADPGTLRAMWRDYPGRLVGVATGTTSGIDVLDIDTKPDARAWWADQRHRLPRTRTHRTRSGGLHLVFRHALDMRCSTGRIAIGVDVRGDGGCAVWWPAAGCPVLCDAPPASWPDWLRALARPPASPRLTSGAVVADDKINRGVLAVVTAARPGERNHRLHWAACRLAESTLDRDAATALLVDAATSVGLGIAEARATINSAYLGRARGSERC